MLFSEEKKLYYEFDDAKKEIIFKRYDMPTPWMNYLTNGEFFTMISQAGGNLSWYKSPEIWRIGRYPFFNLPTDENGLFIYVKDLSTGKVWNPNFIPVHEALDFFESRHGMGYTVFLAEKDGVTVKIKAFVGKANALIYKVNISSKVKKNIILFAAKEMANMEYLREAQWECYTRNSNNIAYSKESDALVFDYFADAQARPDETPYVYFTSSIKSSSFTGVRKDFTGAYRSLSNPKAVEEGKCPDTELLGGESIFAFSYDLFIGEEEQEFCFVLGTASKHQSKEELDELIKKTKSIEFARSEEQHLKDKWDERLSRFHVEVDDPDLFRMANIWNPYQAYVTFLICREISYYATGTVRGVGVRDASQDALSNVIYEPEEAKKRLKDILLEQYQCGKMNHYYYHIEKKPSLVSDRSDNHLWAVYLSYEILMETGDTSFLNEIVPYFDGGEGSVWDHLCASVNFSLNNLGKDGIPLMLLSDWNDCLDSVGKKGKGESVMVAEQLVLASKMMEEMAILSGRESETFKKVKETQTNIINDKFYDGDRYARAVNDDGLIIGVKKERCGQLWLNSNSWAVFSGVADRERGNASMDNVMKYLNSDVGLVKQYPALDPFYPNKENPISWATPGIGENGGVFCHANTWAIIAYSMLHRGDDAYKIYKELLPDHVVDTVGVNTYLVEPYIYSSNIRALYALRGGEGAVSWVTGTATWMNIALQEYMFGIKPKFKGLLIDPVLPKHIKHAKVTRKYQNTTYNIEIENECRGSTMIYIDGKRQESNFVAANSPVINVLAKC